MSKKIAIFCDGTWNDLSLGSLTNVVRLAKCVADTAEDGRKQIVYYDEGVGVGSGVSRSVDLLTKYIGGALGRGLDRKIEAAYRFLVLNYEPGDDIYVFGFSRGAYTARSLCGLIRKCGILKRSCFNRVPEAVKLYRTNLHPSQPEVMDFRARYGHPVSAGEEDRARIGLPATQATERLRTADTREDVYQYRAEPTYRMMYLGLWDTVGAMGIPSRFDFLKVSKARYAFHDTNASTLMASIRHAAAADERRELFDLTPIDNIDELNLEWSRMTGWDVATPAAPGHVPYEHRPYQQRWFPGDHCSVGGGHPTQGLSSGALLWIAEGAAWAGLRFENDHSTELDDAARWADPCDILGTNGVRANAAVGGRRRGEGPRAEHEIAAPTWARYCKTQALPPADRYQPRNIHRLFGAACPAPAAVPPPPGFPMR